MILCSFLICLGDLIFCQSFCLICNPQALNLIMNSAIMGTQSHLFKGKEKRRKKWSWCSFSLLLAVQWRWWKVRRHQMGWYTFIFSNEINHHHSYYHSHKPKEQDRESPHFHSVALVKLEIGSLESTESWKKQMEASRKQY